MLEEELTLTVARREEALGVAREIEDPWLRSVALADVAGAIASAKESRISVSLRVSRFGFFTWGVVEASLLTPSDYSFTLTLTSEQVAEELEEISERISGG